MKLTKDMIDRLLQKPSYELTRKQLEQEWKLDNRPYNKTKDCWNFHAKDGCWLEIPADDVVKAFKGGFKIPYDVDWGEPDFKSTWPQKAQKEDGEEFNEETSFSRGVEHGEKRAKKAFKKVLDKIYDSGFDPTINYTEMFDKELTKKTKNFKHTWID